MKKKIVAMLLSTAMAVSLLAGCGSTEDVTKTDDAATDSSADSTDINNNTDSADSTENSDSIVSQPTELSFIFADGDEGFKETMNELVNKFNEAYEDITVSIEPGNGGAYSEFLKTKDSVGEFPDIMEMRDTATYVRAEKLAALPEDITSLFTTTTEFDGNVYTAPMAGENANGIIYNKAYFDENGLTEPTTYDEFIELCKTIQELGDMDPLVVGGQDIWHMGFIFHYAYSDMVLSQDEDFIKNCYEGTKDFSDETFKAAIEEVEEIMQFAQEGWASTPDAQITTFIVSDMAAMMYSGTHMFSTILEADPDFEMGWFALPSHDGTTRLVGGGTATGLAISAEAAEDPDKKAAAEEFIKFFFEEENYKTYCENMSAIPSTVETPDMDVLSVFQEVIDANSTADVLEPMWNSKVGDNELPPDFRNFTYKTLIEYLQGTVDIDSVCTELNKSWETSMQSFNPLTGVGVDAEE